MARFKYISNEPCGKDLFAGKAHESTAKQIANLLIEAKSSLMIGLEGGWGTGKSNLISLVQKEMRENSPLFFTYDAWGHQDDLTRRSILEELTYYICNNEQASQALKGRKKDVWKTKLKSLLSKKREVRTTDIPKVSVGILFITLAIILTPIFSSIADSLPASTYWFIKPVFTAVPLLITLVYIVVRFCKMRNRSFQLLLEELVSLYKEKTKENTTYEEEFAAEPSSKQFKDWMKELDEDLQNKLVIVFDNMDRLPSHKVQEFWAAIHSFFAEVKYNNIQVIVPFDRKHILVAFYPETIALDTEDEMKIFYGNDFINKTFDVVYRVAPPTMSNWKGYLSSMWKEAIGEELSQESSITQIYDLMTESKSPRKIISFINECITLKNNQSFIVPDEYIALYVVGKYSIQQNPYDELLNLKFCDPLAYKYRNEETSKFLSALYFQLPTEEALELIYTDQLRRELDSGKSDLLLKLEDSTLLNDLLENAIAKVNNPQYATNALTQSGLTIEVKFWDQLLMKTQAVKDSISLKDYQIELLKHTSKNKALTHLKMMIKHLYGDVLIQEDGDKELKIQGSCLVDAVKLYDSVANLSNKLREFDYLNPFNHLRKTNTHPECYVDFIEKAKEEHSKYLIECPKDKVDDYLSKLPVERLNTLVAVPYLKHELPKYQKLLQSQITEVKVSDEAETLLNRWVELESILPTLPSDNNIDNWFSECEKEGPFYYYLVSIRMAKGESYTGSEFNLLSESANEQAIKTIVSHIESFTSYGMLLLGCKTMAQYPMYCQVVQYMISNKLGKEENSLPIDALLPMYSFFVKTLKIKLLDLLQDWSRWKDDYGNKITIENISNVPVAFFDETRDMNNIDIVYHCNSTAINYLQKIESADWEDNFKRKNTQYQLLITTRSNIPKAYEAFKATITNEFKDQSRIVEDDVYQSLVECFERQGKDWSSVYKNIRDMYASSGKNITEQLFVRYGHNIINKACLIDNPESVRTLLPTSLLKNESTLSIITSNTSQVVEIIKHASRDYATEFVVEIKSVLEVEKNKELAELLHLLEASPTSKEISVANRS